MISDATANAANETATVVDTQQMPLLLRQIMLPDHAEAAAHDAKEAAKDVTAATAGRKWSGKCEKEAQQ